jgi:hypothetical protein
LALVAQVVLVLQREQCPESLVAILFLVLLLLLVVAEAQGIPQ